MASCSRQPAGHGDSRVIDELVPVMLKVTGYVMWFAPVAVFAAVAAAIAVQGLGILGTYGKFIGEFYAALLRAVGGADRRRLRDPRPARCSG